MLFKFNTYRSQFLTKALGWGVILFLLPVFWSCQPQRPANTIQFSTWGSPEELKILKPLLAKFESQNPDIKVELLHIPDKYFQKLHTLLAANLAPDVMFLRNIEFPIYASNQAFLPLEPYLQKSQQLKKTDFFPKTLSGFEWQGELQALPRDASNIVVFYNKDLFDRAGLPYPKKDWTLSDMIETAQKLTQDPDRDGNPEVFGLSFHKYFLFWEPYLWSAGGDFFNSTRKAFALNSPESLAGIQTHADLRHKYKIAPTSAQAGSKNMTELFKQEKLAMELNGRWAVPLYRDKEQLKFNWDVAPFPRGKSGSIVSLDASGWAISRQCTSPEKAWRLIEFLASQQASIAFTQPGLIIPARKDVAYSPVFLDPTQPPKQAQVFLDALTTGRPTPAVPYWNAIIEEINQALEPVWDGKKTAPEALRELDRKINRLL